MPSELLRSDFDPMVGGYVIIMVSLGVGLWLSRRSAVRDDRDRPARISGPGLAPVTAAGWAGWPGTWPAPCWAVTCC